MGSGGEVGWGNMNLSFFPRHVRGRVINIALQVSAFLVPINFGAIGRFKLTLLLDILRVV